MNLLITGRPGIGKTTVIEKVIASAPRAAMAGFVTREIRDRGMRRGFAIETLEGRTAILARVDLETGPRIGPYRVSMEGLDLVAVPALAPRPGLRLIVIDEIGKMECLSRRFRDAARSALDAPVPVLATISQHGGGFIEETRGRDDVTLIEVTMRNRDALPARILELIV